MEIRLILDIGVSNKWYGDHWIISCCPHCILGHSHLVGGFDIDTWFSVRDCSFRWIMEILTPWASLLGILGWSRILTYLSSRTQTFHPRYSHAFYHTRAWSSPSFILHIPSWHMTSPLSWLGGDVDQSSIILVLFSYIFQTLGSISSMMAGPDRLLTY